MPVRLEMILLPVLIIIFVESCFSAPVRLPVQYSRVLKIDLHRRSVQECPQEFYWDPIDETCVACQDICQPQHSAEFCQINCHDYYVKHKASIDSSSNILFQSTTLPTVANKDFFNSADHVDTSRYHTVLVGVLALFCLSLSIVLVVVVVCLCRRSRRVPCFGSKISSRQIDSSAESDGASKAMLLVNDHQTLVRSRCTADRTISDNSSDSCLGSISSHRSVSDDQTSTSKVLGPQWNGIQLGVTLQVADMNCSLSPVSFTPTQPQQPIPT